jgi:hypothetical protein
LQRTIDELEQEVADLKGSRKREMILSRDPSNPNTYPQYSNRNRKDRLKNQNNHNDYDNYDPNEYSRESKYPNDEDDCRDGDGIGYNYQNDYNNSNNKNSKNNLKIQHNQNEMNSNNSNNHVNSSMNNEAEDTVAMQTMSLIHIQLTHMKNQLLTISDISKDDYDAKNNLNNTVNNGNYTINNTSSRHIQDDNNSSYVDRKRNYNQPNSSQSSTPYLQQQQQHRDPPGVLHASEQAIQRMFRPQYQEGGKYQERGTPQGKTGPLFTNSNKVSFTPETLYTPGSDRNTSLITRNLLNASAPLPYNDVQDTMDISSSSILNFGSTPAPTPSMIRDKGDVIGGGSGTLGFEDGDEGGFQEGYWRYTYLNIFMIKAIDMELKIDPSF